MPTSSPVERLRPIDNLHTAIEQHVIYLKHVRQLMPSTIFHYRHDLEMFKRFLERQYKTRAKELPISVVTSDSAVSFLRHQTIRRRNSASSNHRRQASLRGFVRFLERVGAIGPQGDLRFSADKRVKRLPDVLSQDEVNGILDGARTVAPNPQRDTAIFLLFLTCGPNLSELLNLNIDDVDLHRGTISFTAPRGTLRELDLSSETQDALHRYLAIRSKVVTQRVFLNRWNKPLTKGGVYNALGRCLEAAGIRRPGISVTTLRNTYILSLLESKKYSRADILKMSGLSSVSALSPYIQLQLKRQQSHKKPSDTTPIKHEC